MKNFITQYIASRTLHISTLCMLLLSGCASSDQQPEPNRRHITEVVRQAYQADTYPTLQPQIDRYVDLILLVHPDAPEAYVQERASKEYVAEHTEDCRKKNGTINCMRNQLFRQSEYLTTNIINTAVAALPDSPDTSLHTLKQIGQPASLAWVSYAYATGTGVEKDDEQARVWMVKALNGLQEKYPFEQLGGNTPEINEAFNRCDGIERNDGESPTIRFTKNACANNSSQNIGDVLWQIKFITASHGGQLSTPCWVMEKHYESLSAFGPYWGGNRDNFPAVCGASWLDSIPQHHVLLKHLQALSGEGGRCSGSMRYAKYAIWKMRKLEAAHYPEMLEEPRHTIQPYLTWWASEGIWNYRQYQALNEEAQSLKTFLIQNGGEHSEKWETTPDLYADRMLDDYFNTYLGNYPSALARTYLSHPAWKELTETRNVEAAMQTGADAYVRARLINHAILFDFPLEDIKTLTQGMQGDDIASGTLLASVGRPSVLAHLLSLNADVESTNDFGKTPLFDAILYSQHDSIRMLVQAGANINATTSEEVPFCSDITAGHRTPLMYAAWHGTPVMARYLIKHGADTAAKDSNGKTAIDYLEKNDMLSDEQKASMRVLMAN